MEYDTSLPIYLQVVNAIKSDIVLGKIRAGDKLPSGRELALTYKINPNTAARVYQVLEQEGITFTRRGLGTFLVNDSEMTNTLRKEMAGELVSHFIENMEALGFTLEEMQALIKEGKIC